MKYLNYHVDICPICQCGIFPEEARYVMPDEDIIHIDCLDDWARKYRRLGEVDVDFCDDDDK